MNAMSTEQLDELRAQYEGADSDVARVIVALLDEVDALDEALGASEDEVDALKVMLADATDEAERLRAKVEPQAVSGWVSRRANGRWQARWCTPDGKQHSQTFERRRDALLFLDEAKREGRR